MNLRSALRRNKKVDETSNELDDCPICTHCFGRRRTKCHPFACEGRIRHVICSDCNSRMFQRHDDRCPFCRGPRSDTSSMGYRPPRSIPDGFSVDAFEIVDTLVDGGAFINQASDNVFSFSVSRDGNVQRGQEISAAVGNESASSIVANIHNDPVFQIALHGLRNPNRMSVRAFVANVSLAGARSRRQ